MKFKIDKFCLRQFDKNQGGLLIDCTPQEIEDACNSSNLKLQNGYAEFCKHLFIPNFTNSQNYYQQITQENKNLLQSDYEARTQYELPVLRRFFNKNDVQTKKAQFLDIILYTKEQIEKESIAIGIPNDNSNIDYQYGIISIKPQDQDFEIQMDPITIMRNALGKEEGGSGVPIDKEIYKASVNFWSKHAIIK